MLPTIFPSLRHAPLNDMPEDTSRSSSAETCLRQIFLPENIGRHAEYLVGMTVGGLAFRGVSGFFAARRVFSGMRWLQGGLAVFAEATAFTAAARGLRHLYFPFRREPEPSLVQDWLTSFLIVAPFHLARAAGPGLANRVANRLVETAEDRRELLPTVTWHVTQQLMMIGAITSQQFEEGFGWRRPRPYSELAWEGVLRLLEYNVAQRGVGRLLR